MGPHYLHGFARHQAFEFDPPDVAPDGTGRFRATLCWDERQADFARFPFKHVLEMGFSVGPGTGTDDSISDRTTDHAGQRSGPTTDVRISYRVLNRGADALPFGFGVHPFFRIPLDKTGARTAVDLCVPAEHVMETHDMLPTGTLLPVRDSPEDLTQGLRLDGPGNRDGNGHGKGVGLDHVFFGMRPEAPARIHWHDLGLHMTLQATEDFGHLVVYTPEDPVFCVENQTCSTDAHNLYAAGHERVSGLQIVPAGAQAQGHVLWKIGREITRMGA